MNEQHEAQPIEGSDQSAKELASARPVVHRSSDLLQGRSEAWIEHDGAMYRLRLTSAGKLYLTK